MPIMGGMGCDGRRMDACACACASVHVYSLVRGVCVCLVLFSAVFHTPTHRTMRLLCVGSPFAWSKYPFLNELSVLKATTYYAIIHSFLNSFIDLHRSGQKEDWDGVCWKGRAMKEI